MARSINPGGPPAAYTAILLGTCANPEYAESPAQYILRRVEEVFKELPSQATPPSIPAVVGTYDTSPVEPNEWVSELAKARDLPSLALVHKIGECRALHRMDDDTVGISFRIDGRDFLWRGERAGWSDPVGLLEALARGIINSVTG